MTTFKPGDKVYCPLYGTQIFVLEKSLISDHYVVLFSNKQGNVVFTNEGKSFQDSKVLMLFHATTENHALLEQLYGMEFEKPTVPPTSREIIQAMLARGDKSVPCWVSSFEEEPSFENISRMIHYIEHGGIIYFVDTDGHEWEFATPFDPRTGKEITELPTNERVA